MSLKYVCYMYSNIQSVSRDTWFLMLHEDQKHQSNVNETIIQHIVLSNESYTRSHTVNSFKASKKQPVCRKIYRSHVSWLLWVMWQPDQPPMQIYWQNNSTEWNLQSCRLTKVSLYLIIIGDCLHFRGNCKQYPNALCFVISSVKHTLLYLKVGVYISNFHCTIFSGIFDKW